MPAVNFSGQPRGGPIELELPRITWNEAEADTETGWMISWCLRPMVPALE